MEENIATNKKTTASSAEQADEYMKLLYGLIRFIKIHHPKYSKYTELVELLGHEHTLKEASIILGKPYRMLYG